MTVENRTPIHTLNELACQGKSSISQEGDAGWFRAEFRVLDSDISIWAGEKVGHVQDDSSRSLRSVSERG